MGAVCAWCIHARDREDICSIYCHGGFVNLDGECNMFKEYRSEEEFETDGECECNK